MGAMMAATERKSPPTKTPASVTQKKAETMMAMVRRNCSRALLKSAGNIPFASYSDLRNCEWGFRTKPHSNDYNCAQKELCLYRETIAYRVIGARDSLEYGEY